MNFGDFCRGHPWLCRFAILCYGLLAVLAVSLINGPLPVQKIRVIEKRPALCFFATKGLAAAYVAVVASWSVLQYFDDRFVYYSGVFLLATQGVLHGDLGIETVAEENLLFGIIFVSNTLTVLAWAFFGLELMPPHRAEDVASFREPEAPDLSTESAHILAEAQEEEASRANSGTTCLSCATNEVGVRFAPCGHAAYCVECAEAMASRNCPTCFKRIGRTNRVFYSGFPSK